MKSMRSWNIHWKIFIETNVTIYLELLYSISTRAWRKLQEYTYVGATASGPFIWWLYPILYCINLSNHVSYIIKACLWICTEVHRGSPFFTDWRKKYPFQWKFAIKRYKNRVSNMIKKKVICRSTNVLSIHICLNFSLVTFL